MRVGLRKGWPRSLPLRFMVTSPVGEESIPPRFTEASPFSGGVAAVSTERGWGHIDHSGEFVIAPQFPFAFAFQGNVAAVQAGDSWYYIDREGSPFWEDTF